MDVITKEGRRGRRPGGQDTRAALLRSARSQFAEFGYRAATCREIAARAGVDAAMISHWFGNKAGLFDAAFGDESFMPAGVARELVGAPQQALGERVVRAFLQAWDEAGAEGLSAMVRSLSEPGSAVGVNPQFLVDPVLRKVIDGVAPDHAQLRTVLCTAVLAGLAMLRYVVPTAPLSTASADTVVALIGPNVQRCMTGHLGARSPVKNLQTDEIYVTLSGERVNAVQPQPGKAG